MAAGRVRRWEFIAQLILLAPGIAAILLILHLLSPAFDDLRAWLAREVPNEIARGVLIGSVAAVIFGPLSALPVIGTIVLDRIVGLRCPQCKRSLTLTIRRRQDHVISTGCCTSCKAHLFEGTGEPLRKRARVVIPTRHLLGGLWIAAICSSLLLVVAACTLRCGRETLAHDIGRIAFLVGWMLLACNGAGVSLWHAIREPSLLGVVTVAPFVCLLILWWILVFQRIILA
jgi:hypothetical protein